MRISISTILGFALGSFLIITSIQTTTNNYKIFINASSAMIVFGGTFAALFISYDFKNIIKMFTALFSTLFHFGRNAKSFSKDIKLLVQWSEEVQKGGLAVLEEKIDFYKKKDEFKYYALTLVSANYSSEELHYLLDNYIKSKYERENIAANMLTRMGGFAPAFGMVGTLIGLIVMLNGLGSDPGKLGQGLAVALNTTLYGVLAANLFFKPISAKIKTRNQRKRNRSFLLAEGFILLQNKVSPIVLQDRLNSFLGIQEQFDMFSNKE